MSNLNDPNRKSFTSMFGTKAPTGNSAQSSLGNSGSLGTANAGSQTGTGTNAAGTAERGSFFKSFVKNGEAKPSAFSAQASKDAPVRTSFSGLAQKSAEPAQKAPPSTPLSGALKKNPVNIPFDISKLTLEEKIAILEKINADIESEAKEKKIMQPAGSRFAGLQGGVQGAAQKPSASSLFKTGAQMQAQSKEGGIKPLFAGRTVSGQDANALANNANAIRSPLARRAAGADAGANEIKITNEEFITLRDFLYDQCGIFVGENRKYLMENRLNTRLRELGLHSFSEYHNYLRYDKNRMNELNELFINMTTNETSFFRNNIQLDVFRDKVLAKVIAEQRAKGEKKLNIWSAGCSSGEEPYTIAIIILELLKGEVNDWNIKITANDLSLAMLNIARKGVYSEYALRTTPPEIIDKYFIREGKNYKIVPAAQRLVQFGQINLARSDQLARVDRSHIVFCRNVIIYFDDAMKKHVINAFYDNLLPGGYLLIGHSESLHNISRTFKPEHHPGAIIYCKQS